MRGKWKQDVGSKPEPAGDSAEHALSTVPLRSAAGIRSFNPELQPSERDLQRVARMIDRCLSIGFEAAVAPSLLAQLSSPLVAAFLQKNTVRQSKDDVQGEHAQERLAAQLMQRYETTRRFFLETPRAPDSPDARRLIDHVNELHHRVSPNRPLAALPEFGYVLFTLTHTLCRTLERIHPTPPSPAEEHAWFKSWRYVAEGLGAKNLPHDYETFVKQNLALEATFKKSPTGGALAQKFLDTLRDKLPEPFGTIIGRFAFSIVPQRTLNILGLPGTSPIERTLVPLGLKGIHLAKQLLPFDVVPPRL